MTKILEKAKSLFWESYLVPGRKMEWVNEWIPKMDFYGLACLITKSPYYLTLISYLEWVGMSMEGMCGN